MKKKGVYFLTGKVNNVFRIECLKCRESIIISDIDSVVVERESQAFYKDHRLCIRNRPTLVEIFKAEDRADFEVSNLNNSEKTGENKEVMVYETTEQ